MDPPDLAALRPAIVAAARAGAAEIMKIYDGPFDVRSKADRSPLTLADERSEAAIAAALKTLAPDIPVVAEEAASRGETAFAGPAPAWFWLVDPLDGTREFVARNGQFAVSIGLIGHGRPVLGAVMSPVEDIVWSGGPGLGAFRQVRGGPETPVRARAAPAKGIVVVSSRSHSSAAEDAYLDGRKIAEHRRLGSSVKFGLLAEGSADLYPRFGPTCEWDTCGGEAVLTAAGGHVTRPDGRLLEYGKPGYLNPDFVARGA